MILGVDAGNTNITFGLMDRETIHCSFRITTTPYLTADELGVRILNILLSKGYTPEDITDIIVTSVVPSIMNSLIPGLKIYLKTVPTVLRNGEALGLPIETDHPNEVGMDRIVDMIAAVEIYGAPCIVVDFGTATTYDLVDADGRYVAGVTAPGIYTSLAGLVSKAAKLTNVEIVVPPTIMAKNTKDSMQAGVTYGQIGQARYIIEQLRRESGLDAKVVMTGGLGAVLADALEDIHVYDVDLTLKGLRIIHGRLRGENEN
ncbi:MAG: type III pantothenate kinase [Eubacteriales bacterium]|nr:type III pantothenate kinase [Eubacteriales bacterium]